MNEYTILLFRSGRVWVASTTKEAEGFQKLVGDSPILMTTVTANSDIAALGKLLLEYVDKAAQPYQHIPICINECCKGKDGGLP